MAISFIGGGNWSTWSTDLPQAIDKFYYIMLYQVRLAMRGIQTVIKIITVVIE
jgi:hypothetical protein